MKDDVIPYVKRVGVIAGTATACVVLLQLVHAIVWTVSWARSSEPIMQAIEDERRERVEADNKIMQIVVQVSRDRVEMVEILAAESAAERIRRAKETRQRWLRENFENH